jgi:hypothetical protein
VGWLRDLFRREDLVDLPLRFHVDVDDQSRHVMRVSDDVDVDDRSRHVMRVSDDVDVDDRGRHVTRVSYTVGGETRWVEDVAALANYGGFCLKQDGSSTSSAQKTWTRSTRCALSALKSVLTEKGSLPSVPLS